MLEIADGAGDDIGHGPDSSHLVLPGVRTGSGPRSAGLTPGVRTWPRVFVQVATPLGKPKNGALPCRVRADRQRGREPLHARNLMDRVMDTQGSGPNTWGQTPPARARPPMFGAMSSRGAVRLRGDVQLREARR